MGLNWQFPLHPHTLLHWLFVSVVDFKVSLRFRIEDQPPRSSLLQQVLWMALRGKWIWPAHHAVPHTHLVPIVWLLRGPPHLWALHLNPSPPPLSDFSSYFYFLSLVLTASMSPTPSPLFTHSWISPPAKSLSLPCCSRFCAWLLSLHSPFASLFIRAAQFIVWI